MAQEVHYFENDVIYEEGPFVMTQINGWRIEVELKGHRCPVLPMTSIYQMLKENGLYDGKTDDKEKVVKAVDWLNEQVRKGNIILKKETYWDAKDPGFEERHHQDYLRTCHLV